MDSNTGEIIAAVKRAHHYHNLHIGALFLSQSPRTFEQDAFKIVARCLILETIIDLSLSVLIGFFMKNASLVIISPLKAYRLPNGNIVLTQKFVDGMLAYRAMWDGPLLHICEPAKNPSHNLDNIEIAVHTAEFDSICADLTDNFLRETIPKKSVVLVSVGEQFNSVSTVCKELGIPCVYITEYSLRTRMQIAAEYQRSRLHGAWLKTKQTRQELLQRRAISRADAVQCNGLPTYRAYRGINLNHHLFFDTRTDNSMLATQDQISRRVFDNRNGKKLRLTFSGRLTLMKGVDDLLVVAAHLRLLLDDWFELSICGDGDYAERLKNDIKEQGLGGVVTMRGTLDFKTELIPFITNSTDIFICCHRQGDPSCTYLETMACGVPIVGYANEAWSQLSKFSDAGWAVKNKNPLAMAELIAGLDKTPELIEAEARKSLKFAAGHTFGTTFKRRIEHLKQFAN